MEWYALNIVKYHNFYYHYTITTQGLNLLNEEDMSRHFGCKLIEELIHLPIVSKGLQL
jgi:hypothetical protein